MRQLPDKYKENNPAIIRINYILQFTVLSLANAAALFNQTNEQLLTLILLTPLRDYKQPVRQQYQKRKKVYVIWLP